VQAKLRNGKNINTSKPFYKGIRMWILPIAININLFVNLQKEYRIYRRAK